LIEAGAALTLAVDIGGTYTRVATVEGARARRLDRFPTLADYDAEIDRIGSVLRDTVAGRHAAAGAVAADAVGVSFGGRLERDGAAVAVALNLPGYVGRPLAADLADRFGRPVRVAHDATCGLLGERGYGALRGYERCGYITLSTGTGSALRLPGLVLSTEAGHQLTGRGRRCTCGQVGCLETVTGGGQIERRLGVAAASVRDEAFWRAYAEALAVGLANFALCAGLDAIALGGAIALERAGLWPSLAAEVARVATYHPPVLLRAGLGADAPLVGAAALHDTTDRILH
jgi:glucokinase